MCCRVPNLVQALLRLLLLHEEGHLWPNLDDVARHFGGVGHGPGHVEPAEHDEEENVEPDRGAEQAPEADGFVEARERGHGPSILRLG